MTVKISIIITTCNRPHLLSRCLGGLLSAGFSQEKHEVWVIDDSAEGTAFTICRSFAVCRYIQKGGQDKGVSASRNMGIKIASGEYLLFLDDDDYLLGGALEKIEGSISSAADFYYGDYRYLYDRYARRVRLVGITWDQMLVQNRFPIGSFLISKRSIRCEFVKDIKSHEDWLFLLGNVRWERSSYLCEEIVVIDKTSTRGLSSLDLNKKYFFGDYLRIYSEFPAPHMEEYRKITLRALQRK